jgi:hypothetical protein
MGTTNKVIVSIDHIYDNHHHQGKVARTPGAKKNLFPCCMTKADIEKSIKRAFSRRKKIGSRQPDFDGSGQRQRFRGFDPNTGLTIVFWYNHCTKTIETAWPD